MTRSIAALRSPTLMNILANFSFWLGTEVPGSRMYVCSTPSNRHSSAELRFRPDFVGCTPRCGRSGWWRGSSGGDPKATLEGRVPSGRTVHIRRVHRHQSQAAEREGASILQRPGHLGAAHQEGQACTQVDALLHALRSQRRAVIATGQIAAKSPVSYAGPWN